MSPYNCCYCGREIETTPCMDCFPLYKCKSCGTVVGHIGASHKKPDGTWCDNPVRGFGDTRSAEFWKPINEDELAAMRECTLEARARLFCPHKIKDRCSKDVCTFGKAIEQEGIIK